MFTTFLTIYHRNWHAPVTLTRNQPVTKTEVYLTFTNAAFVKSSCDSFTSLFRCLAIIFTRINEDTIFMVPFLPFFKAVFFTFTSYNLFNRQIIFMSKFPVTFIMRRGTHYSACTIVYQYIVSNPHRNLLARHRVYCIGTSEHTFFRCICRCTVNITHIAHTRNESF